MLRSPAWRAWLVGAVLVPTLLAASGVFAQIRVAARETSPLPVGRLTIAVRADEVLLAGDVADDPERRALVDAVRSRAAKRRVTDLLTSDGHRLPLTAPVTAGLVAAAIAASAHDFTAVATDGALTARATAADEAHAAALRQALAAFGVREPRVDVAPDVDLADLQRSVTVMLRDNGGIRFEPSSTVWQGRGPVLVDRVGRLLLIAPAAVVTLNGHASAAHPDARALAQRRADTVRDLLVAQGVRPERIRTAVTLDVAPESTDPATCQVDVLIS